MSGVDWEKTIRRLSTLALVELDQTRAEALLHDLEKIIEMFNKIVELGISEEVKPLYATFFGEVNLRDDVESKPMGIEELNHVGERLEDRYLKSPRTL